MPEPSSDQDAATRGFVTRNCSYNIYNIYYTMNYWFGLPYMDMRNYDYEFDVEYMYLPNSVWTYWKFNYSDYPNTASELNFTPYGWSSWNRSNESVDVYSYNQTSNYWNYTVYAGYHGSGSQRMIFTYRFHAITSDMWIMYMVNDGIVSFREYYWQGWTQPSGASYARWMIVQIGGNTSSWAPYVMMIRGGNYQYYNNFQLSIRQVKRVGI